MLAHKTRMLQADSRLIRGDVDEELLRLRRKTDIPTARDDDPEFAEPQTNGGYTELAIADDQAFG